MNGVVGDKRICVAVWKMWLQYALNVGWKVQKRAYPFEVTRNMLVFVLLPNNLPF